MRAETRERARHTLEFTLDHSAAIDFLNLAVFNLPAYSVEARALETLPFYDGDLSLYREFVHPAGWNRDAAWNCTRPARLSGLRRVRASSMPAVSAIASIDDPP